ncbi:hypothetical protein GN958_ATG22735 [Phytophthora infestans]|nr:hypothetical protein GN958_ATG22735 [Phytophthora infestans]
MSAQAIGHVDLYQDAYFKHKVARVRNVQSDICYNLACLVTDNVVTSVKWSGLPETGKAFKRESSIILFYTDRDCFSDFIAWPVNTQSRDDLYFPVNFRLDGINDAVSSFMVADEWVVKGYRKVCNEAGLLDNSTSLGYIIGSTQDST